MPIMTGEAAGNREPMTTEAIRIAQSIRMRVRRESLNAGAHHEWKL